MKTVTVEIPVYLTATATVEVTFDPETGQAELVSSHAPLSCPDSITRRQLQREVDPDQIDRLAYITLLDAGELPVPADGETVNLHGEPHQYSDSVEAETVTAEDVADGLQSLTARRRAYRTGSKLRKLPKAPA